VVVATAAPDVDEPMLVALAALFGAEGYAAQTWRSRARCRGDPPARWFPTRGADLAPLRATCRRCPVKADCLEFALAQANYSGGLWASSTPKQRAMFRRRGWSVDEALRWLADRGW
jgi:WhiB family redox-sensing transcriptional regulator